MSRRRTAAMLHDLVESNLAFVAKVAGEYRGLGLPFEDLLNEGNIGLLEAARRFDPGRGVKFITYAVWWIRKAMLIALSDKARLVRVPYNQLRRRDRISQAEAHLRGALRRAPSRRDLALHLEVSEREIERWLQTGTKPFSLDRPAQEPGSAPIVDFLASTGRSSEQRVLERERRELLGRAFVELTEAQRCVLVMRFGLDGEAALTLQQVGERLRLSRERIRQIEKGALALLRQTFGVAHAGCQEAGGALPSAARKHAPR